MQQMKRQELTKAAFRLGLAYNHLVQAVNACGYERDIEEMSRAVSTSNAGEVAQLIDLVTKVGNRYLELARLAEGTALGAQLFRVSAAATVTVKAAEEFLETEARLTTSSQGVN